MALAITKDNFEEISASQLPVVIDFWAEWCGPCRMISPIIDELAGEYEGRAVIGKCDVDNNDDIVGKFMVRNIPTIVFIKGGQVVDKQVGAW
jgi:thioredoxin 1